MKNNRPSTDGFVPRRARSQLGELQNMKHPERQIQPIDRSLHTGSNVASKSGVINRLGAGRTDYNIGEAAKYYDENRMNRGNKHSDLSASLSGIDDEETDRRHRKRRRKTPRFEGVPEKPRRRRKRISVFLFGRIELTSLETWLITDRSSQLDSVMKCCI